MASLAYPIYTHSSPSSQTFPYHESNVSTINPISTINTRNKKRAAATAATANITRALKAELDLTSLFGLQDEQDDTILNDTSVLHTPRRGRRVGKVNLGWQSPYLLQQQQQQEVQRQSLTVSPRKRKVEAISSGANIRLIDSHGRASAAIAKLASNFSLEQLEELSTSPHFFQSINDQPSANVTTYDKLAGFLKEENEIALPALVSVEVPLMGRMAVKRSEANRIACMDTSILFQSTGGSSDISSASTSTQQTSDVSYSLDPSPSFSLSSHFPASEPNSPSKAFSKQEYHSLIYKSTPEKTIKEKIQTIRDAHQRQQSLDDILETTPTGWRPRLEGSGMPSLNWPDSPEGPWSSAGKEVRRLQEQKRQGIARWLEEDSEDESYMNNSNEQQHPMVAKAMHDRARKEMLIRSLSMSHLTMSKHLTSVRKSSKRHKIKKERDSKKRILDQKTVYLHPPPKAVGRLTGFTLSSPSSNSIVGCSCGSTDETTEMVMCDTCNSWFHLACIGVARSTELGEEWFCHSCCDIASSVLSPSILSDRVSLIATPNFPRSAAIAGQQLRLSQGQLPVFAQPSNDSPLLRGELRLQQQHILPTALALAPSPTLPSSHHSMDRRSNSGKRHRANRVGWHQVEPGSPLERKSGLPMSSSHQRSMSGNAINGQTLFAAPSPSRKRVSDKLEHHEVTTVAPPRTPSPHFNSAYSKTRSAATNVRHYREHSNRDVDDVFSTPSRILQGSASWGAPQWQQASTHNTSMMRHAREDSAIAVSQSTPWGLSTPTRFMDPAEFHSDHSDGHGGLPSLVFSSGGLDLADLTWQLQSPSSSTRAATRARQNSSNQRVSSARDKTPTPQSSQGKSSCASSSPFPKTPTFTDLTMMSHPHHSHYQQQYNNHHYHQSPQSTANKKFNNRLSQQEMTPTAASIAAAGTNYTSQSANSGAKMSSQPKARHVSSGDLMAGLGIGLDLEDVLDWA